MNVRMIDNSVLHYPNPTGTILVGPVVDEYGVVTVGLLAERRPGLIGFPSLTPSDAIGVGRRLIQLGEAGRRAMSAGDGG